MKRKKTDPIIPANAEPALVKTNTESRTDNTTTPQTVAVVEKTVGKIGENISEQKNQEDPKKEKTEAKKTDSESPKINTGTEPSLVTTPEKKIDSNLNGKGSPVSDSVLSSGSNPSTNQEDKSKPSTPVETADQKKINARGAPEISSDKN